ncbi:MAG: hypothetical protein ABI634_00385 [Acidobacteriota bacterium]
MTFVTIATRRYLPMALQLAATIRAADRSAEIWLWLAEPPQACCVVPEGLFDRVLVAEEWIGTAMREFVRSHDELEACCGLKPTVLLTTMDLKREERQFVLIDGDAWVFGPFDEVARALQTSDVVLTPHLLEAEATRAASDDLRKSLRWGVCNLGFIAVRQGARGREVLEWWRERCLDACTVDPASGLFLDQKWMDLALAFDGVAALRHPGYNVNPTNAAARGVSSAGGRLVAGADRLPVRFVHFCGFGRSVRPTTIFDACNEGSPLRRLVEEYDAVLQKMDFAVTRTRPWGYASALNG